MLEETVKRKNKFRCDFALYEKPIKVKIPLSIPKKKKEAKSREPLRSGIEQLNLLINKEVE